MSDDEQIPFNNKTHDRLTELEKKFKAIDDLTNVWLYSKEHVKMDARIDRLIKHGHPGIKIKGDQNFERIKELKASSASHTEEMKIDCVDMSIGALAETLLEHQATIEEILREVLLNVELKGITNVDKGRRRLELLGMLGGEIEQYGRKDGNPSLSVKPTDTSKPLSICTLQEQKKCYSSKSILCLHDKITTCLHGKTKLEKPPSKFTVKDWYYGQMHDTINPSEQDDKFEVRFGGGNYTETPYKEKEPTNDEYDEHLSWKGNLRKLMKGKVLVLKEDLEWYDHIIRESLRTDDIDWKDWEKKEIIIELDNKKKKYLEGKLKE
ncbi:hypothetical protein LCGC14_0531580 [marine sediment metagenome]|uniref:Uncharacterized protein n=1 Tax=marine sediment metagenome TaxID=412755 RepID=A0A0F9SDY3_9ZZZZ